MSHSGHVEVVCEGDLSRTDAPLVTHWLQCYKHERYVGAAVQSVLGQTYSPLEILISDDASPDRTWEVAACLARSYRGSHRVMLYRSERNTDSFEHINDVWPLIHGEFVVWQSSDDIADPDYVAAMTEAWRLRCGGGVWSNHTVIDERGRELGVHLPRGRPFSLNPGDFADGRFLDFSFGGVLGFRRTAFERFGPMPRHLGTRGIEHQFGFRAALSGGTSYIERPLVRRRYHPDSLTDGIGASDRTEDPLVVHARRTKRRIMILVSLRETLATDEDRVAAEETHPNLSAALLHQIGVETRRWFALEALLDRRAHAANPHAPEFAHSGVDHTPAALRPIRKLPGGFSLLAFECQYYAVPQAVGAIEPCGLRNGVYPGVVCAWSQADLFAELARRGFGSDPQDLAGSGKLTPRGPVESETA